MVLTSISILYHVSETEQCEIDRILDCSGREKVEREVGLPTIDKNNM